MEYFIRNSSSINEKKRKEGYPFETKERIMQKL